MHLCDTITSGSKFGGAIRDIITSDLFKSIFPNVVISDTFAAKITGKRQIKVFIGLLGLTQVRRVKEDTFLLLTTLSPSRPSRMQPFLKNSLIFGHMVTRVVLWKGTYCYHQHSLECARPLRMVVRQGI